MLASEPAPDFDKENKSEIRNPKSEIEMSWIKTIPFEEADENLQKILMETRSSYPPEYAGPQPAAIPVNESIVESHTLIPEALKHAFMTFSALMSPDLPLSRRQHEMIATVVSETNDCFY